MKMDANGRSDDSAGVQLCSEGAAHATVTGSLAAAAVAAMRAEGFEPEFPSAVLDEVSRLEESSGRAMAPTLADLRQLAWSSIDNRSSRDLDQIEVAERVDDSIRVCIGVADVGALLPLRCAAEAHAALNTTSVYTGAVTFPMLPERLSTDLTSLNEGADRLALIVEFMVDAVGSLGAPVVYRALVRNHAKLTYESVGAWLDGNGPPPVAFGRHPELARQIELQDEAARRLRSARTIAGALNFESVEATPVVANGKVVDLAVARRNRARDLIEDFMVAANRAVALFLLEHNTPSIRRVVRAPRRWDRIVALAGELGERLPDQPDNKALAEFLARRRAADPEHFVDLSLSVVKLLGPGEYVLERRIGNRRLAGHFGLAVADYVHTTAPNRRFVDLVTQRLLHAVLTNSERPYSDAELAEIARHCTERSTAARKVERSVRKIAGATLLAERVGESFTAVITASSSKGVYARLLRPPVEGRVVDGGRGLDVGDTVRLTLVSVNPARGYIDLAHETAGSKRKLERSRRKKAAADRLRARIGETFDAEVTGISESGTWIRLADGSAEGKVVRGYKPLRAGMRVPVRLVATDSVHGFIDFEYAGGIDSSKDERTRRKRAAARELQDSIGVVFAAVVTGISAKATWIKTGEGIEGRLVRGRAGLRQGDQITAVLLTADPVRGFIDFALEQRSIAET
jgi:exoribonuclease-2